MTIAEELKQLQDVYASMPFFRTERKPDEGMSDYMKRRMKEYQEWSAKNPQLVCELDEMEKKINALEARQREENNRAEKKKKAITSSGASRRDLETLAELVETAAWRHMCEWLQTDKSFLLLSGVSHSGKTVASIGAIETTVNTAKDIYEGMVMFIRAVDIARWLSFRDENTLPNLKKLKQTHFLVIDGLGSEFTNDMMRQVLFDVLDFRHGNKLRTVLTSTFPPEAAKGAESFESVYGSQTLGRIKRNGSIYVLTEEV